MPKKNLKKTRLLEEDATWGLTIPKNWNFFPISAHKISWHAQKGEDNKQNDSIITV